MPYRLPLETQWFAEKPLPPAPRSVLKMQKIADLHRVVKCSLFVLEALQSYMKCRSRLRKEYATANKTDPTNPKLWVFNE